MESWFYQTLLGSLKFNEVLEAFDIVPFGRDSRVKHFTDGHDAETGRCAGCKQRRFECSIHEAIKRLKAEHDAFTVIATQRSGSFNQISSARSAGVRSPSGNLMPVLEATNNRASIPWSLETLLMWNSASIMSAGDEPS